ncbi:hypothetical protein D9M68_728330 [compost metagenome]
MADKKLLFSFEDFGSKDKATKAVVKYFTRAGASVAQVDASPAVRRTSGVSYRELVLTFADSQSVTLRIKQTGDIYQVLLNGKVRPIQSQDDHAKAIAEVVKAMDAGRSSFQQKLARAKAQLPPSIKTAAPRMEQVLTEKRDALREAIAEAKKELEGYRAAA